jgi:hypothetical protein
VLKFADAHFAHLIREAVTTRIQRGPTPDHALLPTGYEDALRAIGHELDRRRGDRVTVIELEQCLLVRGHQPTGGCEHRRVEWVLAAEELTALLDVASSRWISDGLIRAVS